MKLKMNEMNAELQKERDYIKKVVQSCVTKEQLANAKKWACDWAERMQKKYSLEVGSWFALYKSVTNDM